MGNVVNVQGVEISDRRGRNKDCLETAKRLVRKAKDGEIVGFVSAVQYADGSIGKLEGGYIQHTPIAGALFSAAVCIVTKD